MAMRHGRHHAFKHLAFETIANAIPCTVCPKIVFLYDRKGGEGVVAVPDDSSFSCLSFMMSCRVGMAC